MTGLTASIELHYRTIIYYQLLQQETRVNVLMLVKQFTVSVKSVDPRALQACLNRCHLSLCCREWAVNLPPLKPRPETI